jgi:uncharacterized protein (DUF58 family)
VADDDTALLDAETARALGRLSLVALDAVVAGFAGRRARSAYGIGSEFADYRPYAPGDDLRRLDWSVYLRRRELLTKVGPDEGRVVIDLLIDSSGSMESGRPPKLRHAERIAAALGAVALLRGNTVRAWALSDGRAEGGMRLETPRMLALLERELAGLRVGQATDLPASLRGYRSTASRADLAVLVSDALVPQDSLGEALEDLVSGARASAFVHLVDRGEAAVAHRGPVVLRDRETGRRLELTLSASVASEYERRFEGFRRAVEIACTDAGVSYVIAPTDVPVLDLLSVSARSAGIVAV